MVVSVSGLFKELEQIETKGLTGAADRIYISDRAQVCFDLHAAVDGLEEKELAGTGGKIIGTTGKGIGRFSSLPNKPTIC
jgi:adenylosuccinate synthase